MLCKNIGRDAQGNLTFAGQSVAALAEQYGTPLYLMDEDRIRENCRLYLSVMREAFGEGSYPLYASKAACFKRIYTVLREEGMAADFVSLGEIHTAVADGFPMEKTCFHGNNKTDEEIAYAMDHGVGCFIVDSAWELDAVEKAAEKRGAVQDILLRLTPGIDPHTYEAIATGKVDSKFGTAIETGQAMPLVQAALGRKHVRLLGYHCHVGSQVFDEDGTVYHDAADIMLRFAKDVQRELGFTASVLNLGGGYGVRYVESDPPVDIAANLRKLASHIRAVCQSLGFPMPQVRLEPGRSIVADAGMTLYRVGTVKQITGYKNYVSIDGGMTDNPRYALYGAKYTVLHAARTDADFRCDLVGRCCESGDVIQPDILLPKPQRGDVIAVCTTGAYNYSMASNYNRVPRPPIVMLHGGTSEIAVRRETPDDLIALDQ